MEYCPIVGNTEIQHFAENKKYISDVLSIYREVVPQIIDKYV